MAFQSRSDFVRFLKSGVADPDVSVRGPRENFLLDECQALDRQKDYLQRLDAQSPGAYNTAAWSKAHVSYGGRVKGIGEPNRRSITFSELNAPNLTPSTQLEPNHKALRLDSVAGLWIVWSGNYVSPRELYRDLGSLIAARSRGMDAGDSRDRLQQWLDGLNRRRDGRPSWATTRAAVADIVGMRHHWAPRLRDALGLAHMVGKPQAPCYVVLVEYPLQRVFEEHRHAPGWAATPTVLDDVSASGINYVFFPAARSATSRGMGFAVDLDADQDQAPPEFLHAPVHYQLDDFQRVAEIATEIDNDTVQKARARHLARFRAQYRYAVDLP